MKVKSLSRVRLFATPWTVAHQAPPPMGFSRQDTGGGCHFLLQGIFPTQGSNPGHPTLQADALTSEPPGRPNPSKMVGVAIGHQKADTLKPYSQKTSQSNHMDHSLNSMKPSRAPGATQDGRVMVERSDRMWSTGEGNGKPLQYSCFDNPMNSMKRQNGILKEELPGQ